MVTRPARASKPSGAGRHEAAGFSPMREARFSRVREDGRAAAVFGFDRRPGQTMNQSTVKKLYVKTYGC
ncbi:MAG: hypothetical protein KDE35_18015, partial [Geminicoccaceae bacterium]|nr:hypothetical protein [Geminicoccaceae bacterium]